MAGEGEGRARVPAVVTIAGGLLMVVGSLLPFVSVEAGAFGGSQTFTGLDTPDGKFTLGAGVALAVLGAVILAAAGVLPKVMGGLALVLGGVMAVLIWMDIASLGADALRNLVRESGAVPPGVSEDQVVEILEQSGVSVSAGVGLYLAFAGAIVGAVGGIMALVARTRRPEAAPPSASPEAPPAPPPPPPAEPG